MPNATVHFANPNKFIIEDAIFQAQLDAIFLEATSVPDQTELRTIVAWLYFQEDYSKNKAGDLIARASCEMVGELLRVYPEPPKYNFGPETDFGDV